jgi:hypothetical protein
MTDEYLCKIDIIRERANVGYQKAAETLEAAGGNIVQALIMLEKEKASSASNRCFTDELRGVGSKMADTIKDVVDRGNKMHVKVRKDDNTVVSMPVTIGVLGAVLAPVAMLVGAAAALAARCSVSVEEEGQRVTDEYVPPIV